MTKIHAYFLAERIESLIVIAIGTAAIVCGFYFLLVINKSFSNGVSWPLLIVAIIQLTVSAYIYFKTPADENRVVAFSKKGKKNIKNIEIPRMEIVMTKFKLYLYLEMGLIVLGLILFLLSSPEGFWRGVGLGMVIQGGIMLLADSFAENRGQRYLDFLRESFG